MLKSSKQPALARQFLSYLTSMDAQKIIPTTNWMYPVRDIGQALPADKRQAVEKAFNAGYAAGWNDAFAGYDGGWALGMPYVVTLAPGSGAITYRIGTRTPLQPGIAYYLCPNGRDLCQRPGP